MNKYPDFTFAHAGLNVVNREQAEAWYEKNLNMKIVRSVVGGPCFLADPTGRVILELYAKDEAAVLGSGEGHFLTHHLAFLVEDPQKTAERLIKAGAAEVYPLRVTDEGDIMVMLKDPFGLYMQFLKRKEPMF